MITLNLFMNTWPIMHIEALIFQKKKRKGFEEGVDRKVLKFKHRNKHMKGLTRRKLNTRKKIRIFWTKFRDIAS